MKNQSIKCSFKNHKEIDSINYCIECKRYMCNKCINQHNGLFDDHNLVNLDKDIQEIFTGICKEKDHSIKLEYYCKNHNQLCCAACLCKIKDEVNGQHKDCDVLKIDDIKDEKMKNLKENIKLLEDLSNNLEKYIEELKIIFEKINKNKEALKLNIQNIFTKIRNALNEREDKLLLEVDNKFNDIYINEDVIKKSEKLPDKIKISLEKGKLIEKEWNNKELNLIINDCINIEKNIEDINIINKNIKKLNSKNNINIKISLEEKEINDFLQEIKSFGKILNNDFKYKFNKCPNNINENRKYLISGDNNNIFTQLITENYTGTICENELIEPNEYKWKIKILKTRRKEIMIGVAPIDFNINSSNFSSCGWYLYCYNSYLYSGPPYNYSNKATNISKVKDEVIVVLNINKRTLKFIINNEDKGDQYINLPIDKPLSPAVILYDKDDSIKIIEY